MEQIRKNSVRNRLLYIVLAVISALTLTLAFRGVANAATTYNYSSDGKLVVNYNGTSYSLPKQPIQTAGKNDYRGTVKINWTGGKQCMLGIQVLASPNATSGAVSTPAFLNGVPGTGNSGQSYTESCPKDFAASQSAFNTSVSIGTSGDTAPTNPEDEGGREVNVTVYSPVKDPPAVSVTKKQSGTSDSTKQLKWSSDNSVASAIWANIDAGTTMQFCITPASPFDTQQCKSGTKERGKPLVITFGTFENSYNPTGKDVKVNVNLNIPAAPGASSYGPLSLTIYSADQALGNTNTNSKDFGGDSKPTVAQPTTLTGTFQDIEPGSYRVCITGNAKLCSSTFTKAVNIGATAEINVSEEDTKTLAATTNDAPTCNPEIGIGWLLCPIMNFFGQLNDAAFGMLQNFLTVKSYLLDSSQTQKAWGVFLGIANVLFVIAFLFIIYSQITGVGISNYNIKRMLPRLIITAILVNASLIICQLAVDISNVVGMGIYNILMNLIPTNSSFDSLSWQSVISSVLGAAVVGLAGVALIILIVTTPTVLLVVGAIILILIGRQAAVLLLTIIAPVALVAYLLPNTESLTKKWYKFFLALLLLFPIIGLVFGTSRLAASLVYAASGQGTDAIGSVASILSTMAATTGPDVTDTIFLQIIALVIQALPLIAVPSLLFGALRGLGAVGAKIEGYGNRSMSHAAKKTKEGRVGEAMTAFNARRQTRMLNRRRGNGWVQTNKDAKGWKGAVAGTVAKTGFGTYQKRLDESAAGQYLGGNRGAAAATASLYKEFDDEVKRQKTLASGRSNDDLLKDLEGGKGSAEYQSAIAGVIMSRSHRESHLKALDIMGKRNTAAETSGDKKALDTVSSVQKQMAEDMKSKPFALGDMATGQLVNGTYGRKYDHEGNKQVSQFGDIQKELRDRVGTKLSAAGLANLDPDEMKRIMAAANENLDSENGFTTAQATSLVKAIQEARANPQVDALIKPEARAQHDQILAKYASLVSQAATPAPASKPSIGPIGSEVINNPASQDGNRLDVR